LHSFWGLRPKHWAVLEPIIIEKRVGIDKYQLIAKAEKLMLKNQKERLHLLLTKFDLIDIVFVYNSPNFASFNLIITKQILRK
jgi:hypothetical protein